MNSPDAASLASKIETEVAAARAAPEGDPDAAVRAVAAAAEAAGELAGVMLGGSALDARGRFERLAEIRAIPAALAQQLRSLASFETFAYRQCKTALDTTLLDLIVREELDPLLAFAALAKSK